MFKICIIISLLSISVGGCGTNTPRAVESAEIPVVESPPPHMPIREAKPFDPQRDIGSIADGVGCQRLRILSDALKPGDLVQIVKVERPQEILSATIIEPVDCPVSKKSALGEFVIDSEFDKEIVEYQVEFADKGNEFDFHLGIAIVNTANKVVVKNGVAELDIPGKAPLRFWECTSLESLHLTVWAGKPLVGKRIWHAYQHFLYETEPSCRHEKETSDLYEKE